MSRFDYLLRRYLDDEATEREVHELMKLIDHETPLHEKEIAREWTYHLDTQLDEKTEVNEYLQAQLQALRTRLPVAEPEATHTTLAYKDTPHSTWWLGLAAAALLILAVVTVWWEEEMPWQTSPPEAETVYTGRRFVHLPDGSTVTLNEDSRLAYKESFGVDTREVTLTGEAYFDVQRVSKKPFIVCTGSLKTTVLGTAFNVQAYQDQTDVVVTVVRGKVTVGDAEQVYDQLLPEEQLLVNADNHRFKKRAADSEDVLRWKEQFLIIDHLPMAEAVQRISERFNTEVVVEHEALKNCIVVATFFEEEGLPHILTMLCRITGATYTMANGRAVIHGGNGCL